MPKYCISSGYSHIQTAIKPQKHRKRKHQDCTEEHGSWGRVDSWKRLLLPRYSAEKAGGLVDFWGSLEIPCFSLVFKWKQWGFTSLLNPSLLNEGEVFIHMWVISVEITYPDVCIIPISAVVQNLMNQYQPWRQLNKKIEQASENSKCGKSQRLFIFLYKASHSSLMHQKTCNRAGTPMSRH